MWIETFVGKECPFVNSDDLKIIKRDGAAIDKQGNTIVLMDDVEDKM